MCSSPVSSTNPLDSFSWRLGRKGEETSPSPYPEGSMLCAKSLCRQRARQSVCEEVETGTGLLWG